jgi:hypothetical protein
LEGFYLRRTIAIAAISLVVVGVGAPRRAGARDEEGPKTSPPIDLDDVSRELDNPLTNLWSLTFENKVLVKKGNATADRELANTLFFQPGLPIPFGKNQDMVFIARPVFPIVTVPVLDPTKPDGVNGRATGFGDLQMLSLFGPNRKDGVVWGLGMTAKFPTHSDDALGIDKYQAGPAAMLFSIGRPWVFGALVQSWFSYAGDSSARSVKQTDIQYVIRYALPHAWSVGTGPTISIDWERGRGDKLTLPVGLGLTKTLKIGRFPVKFRAEAHYSVVRPDDFGTEWTFVFRFAPVIPSPFSR